jgi:hypothetical protein
LWANAFNDDYSAFAEQQLKLQKTRFLFARDEEKGGFEKIEIGSDIGQWKTSENHSDMAYLILNESLLPGQNRAIEMVFELKIPYQFSRLGKKGNYIQLVHWMPKPAVYDKNGWNWFPYLAAGEFYNEYGNYDVKFSFPDSHKMVSTGEIIGEENSGDRKSYHIQAEDVIDFAICLHTDFQITTQEYIRGDGSTITLNVFGSPESPFWPDSVMLYLQRSISHYEDLIGRYAYPQLTVVQEAYSSGGGMEYPMLITIGGKDERTLDYYINHEVGHQWFYGMLGFNERKAPYLDEGLTTYYEHRYTVQEMGQDFHTSKLSPGLTDDFETPVLQQVYIWQKRRGFSESPSRDPGKSSLINYGVNAYERSAYVYSYLASYIGEDKFDEAIRALFDKWKFKHPDIGDLAEEIALTTGENCEWLIPLLSNDVNVDFTIEGGAEGVTVKNKGNISLPYQLTSEDGSYSWYQPLDAGKESVLQGNYSAVNENFIGLEASGSDNHLSGDGISISPFLSIDNSRKSELYYSPLVTWNYADGFSLGTALYNSTFPTKKIQYLIAPQYGLSSQGLIGNAWLAYNAYSSGNFLRKAQIKISGKRYSNFYNQLNDYRTQYIRLVPQVSFHFRKAPNSQKYSKLTMRSIYINEEFADFVGAGDFEIAHRNHFIHQLRYDFFDFNVLNRKEYYFMAEQQSYDNPFGEREDYLKLSGAVKYRLLYRSGHAIQFRLFASGFLKNTQRESSSFSSQLTRGSIALMHQGFNDYAYEDYYLNRQQGAGPFTNQISNVYGGFKDALGPQYTIGQSNDFAAALHVSADLPMNLPSIFKLKPYIDVGYYRTKSTLSEALRGETLVSGGLMLSYLDGGLEIYIPIFSSSAISNIYDELGENIFQRISFSIDLHRLNPWDLVDDLNF